MINILKKLKFIFILIPLGIIIRYVDLKVTKDGFLSTNETADHYIFVIGLLFIVIGLVFVIIYFEKKSNP